MCKVCEWVCESVRFVSGFMSVCLFESVRFVSGCVSVRFVSGCMSVCVCLFEWVFV